MSSWLPWVLNKAVLVSTSVLLGAFFVHWLADHPLIWEGPKVHSAAVSAALRYYSHIYHAPPFYGRTLGGLAGVALGSSLLKLVLNPVQGLLFDGATFIYTSNVLAALRYLPLDALAPGSPSSLSAAHALAENLGGEVRLVEALQSVAASHMIIAVSLTGVLALQGAQGWAERPSSAGQAVIPAAGVVPATQTAPVPVHGEKEPEKGAA
ncbi:hypothetical protein Rhopal_000555-T1 [Rhodotorula paludigena]|uniref:Shr3 amino acid permease chaperone n=1 Tax=Rhodotorula paludigena TaxID=86838 RepID=A0AAV5GD80_9BASI|nr:hypothetical protein Rhopal_000555-T1 [Rhodotorula paludigena]